MQQKKLIILYASPRKNGFTNQLLDQVKNNLPDIWSYRQFDPYHVHVSPCIDCRVCEKGPCPFNQKDDYQDLLNELKDADAILIASPIYFSGFPAPLKNIIDRSQQFFMNRGNNRATCFPNRRNAYLLLTAGASDISVNDATKLSAEMFFRCMNANFVDTYILEQTDFLDTVPAIPKTFLSSLFGKTADF